MSKNLTRKGAALGALVALGTTLFAGAPAFADDKVVLAADYTHDKSTSVPMDYYIELSASLAPHSTAANIEQLSYSITAPDDVRLYVWNNGFGEGWNYTSDGTAFNISNGTNADQDMYYTPAPTDHNYLGLELYSPDITDDTISVTVNAFIDANNDGLFTTGEASQSQVVKFVKYADITTSSKFTAPIIEDDGYTTVEMSFTNVNNEAIDDNEGSYAIGAELTTGTGSYLNNWYDDGPDYDSTINGWIFDDFYLNGGADADAAVKFHPWLYSSDYDEFVDVGTVISTDVVTRTVGDVVISAVRSLTAKGGTGDTEFQTNSTFQQKIHVYDNTDDEADLAGVEVFIGVYDNDFNLSSTKTLTINGTTYTADNKLPYNASGVAKLSVGKTDANGDVVVTFTTKGFEDGNDFDVEAFAENQTDQVNAYANDSYYVAYPTNFGESDMWELTNNVVKGGTTTLNVNVQDQYGAAAPNNTFEVVAELDDWDGYSTDPTSSGSDNHAAVTGGKAVLAVTPNGTASVGDVAYFDVYLYAKASNGTLSGSSSDVDFDNYIAYLNINTVDAADLVVGKVVVSNGTKGTDGVYALNAGQDGASNNKQDLNTKDFASWDERTSIADETETNGGSAYVAGSVKTTSTTTYASVSIPNSVITVSGAGMQFEACGGLVYDWETECTWSYGAESLTFHADYAGNYNFYVSSHLAGKQTVTITVNGVSSKVYVNFNNAAITAAKNVVVKVADGSSQFQAGRALDVAVTVTDKFGNPIVVSNDAVASLKLTQTGVGYLGQSVDGKLDDAGSASNKLVTSFGDLGTSTITAKLDFVSSSYDDISTVVSSELGLTDADVSVGGRAVYAAVEFAKGKTVTVYVDGKRIYSKVQTSDNYTELKFTQKKAGKHVVTVRVSGGIIVSEKLTTTK